MKIRELASEGCYEAIPSSVREPGKQEQNGKLLNDKMING